MADYLVNSYAGRINPTDLHSNYTLSRCNRCLTFFQVNVLRDETLPMFYETVVASSPSEKEERRTCNSIVRDHYFGCIARQAGIGARVLDFGAGWGHFLDIAQTLGLETVAVEINSRQVNHLSRRHEVADLNNVAPRSIDFIRADQVFEHVSRPLDLLQVLSEKLAPKGVVAISVPSDFNPRFMNTNVMRIRRHDWSAAKGTRWSLNGVAPLEHVQNFSDKSLPLLGSAAQLQRWQPPGPIALGFGRNRTLVAQHALRMVGRYTGTIFFQC